MSTNDPIIPSQTRVTASASIATGDVDLNTSLTLRGSPLPPSIERPTTNKDGELSTAERSAFHQKVAMIGYGVYGKAIHSRLSEKFDILPWERKSSNHPSSDLVTTNLSKAIEDRGILVLAVPSNAFPDILGKIRPHKESVVVSLAKGLIVPDWNPLESEKSLREGPPEGARALTPIEYLRQHPNWSHVADNVVFAGGPGFAKEVKEGAPVGLTLSGTTRRDPTATDALGKTFNMFSGMSGDKIIEIYTNPAAPALAPISLEISASMKNVAAFAAGIILGILKKNGALQADEDGRYRVTKRVSITYGDHHAVLDNHTMHRLVHFASKEIVNIVKSEGGGKGSQLMMAGNYDLNLTVNSLTSRNVQAGMRLACGENIYDILTTRDADGHLLTAEGVMATHAMARRIQNNNKTEAYAPLVFAVRNILMGRGTPEAIIAQYFGHTKNWTEADAHKVLNGKSKPLGLRVHLETPPTAKLN